MRKTATLLSLLVLFVFAFVFSASMAFQEAKAQSCHCNCSIYCAYSGTYVSGTLTNNCIEPNHCASDQSCYYCPGL